MSNKKELFSEQSERIVLATLLNHPQKLGEHYSLDSKLFSSVPNKIIFSTLQTLYGEGLTPDRYLVIEHIKATGKLDSAGGEEYIEALTKLDHSPENFREFAQIVINSYQARTFLSLGNKFTELVHSTDTIGSAITYVKDKLDSLVTDFGGEVTRSIKDAATAQWNTIQERIKTPGITGKSVGFPSIDTALNGASPGDLFIIAGRPSQGKTSWMYSSALRCGHPSLIFSKEMSTEILVDRMLATESGVPLSKIKRGTFSGQEEIDKIAEAVEKLRGKDIYIDSNFSADITYMTNTIRNYHQTHHIQFVYLDYVQLMIERDESSTHEIGRVSRALKLIANELGITVFLLSQLNRSVEMRENKRPILSDLRQSGNLEEDADVVIFLYRDEYYYEDSEYKGSIENLIRKNRNGPIGTVYLEFSPEIATVIDKGVRE